MDTKKVVIVLLIIAIVLSVTSVFMSKNVQERFVTVNRNNVPDVDSGSNVGFGVINPNGFVLGVLDGF